MEVNPKKPISFKNTTKYFSPFKDKVRVTVSSSRSYQSKCSKTDGYEARLYYHYKYCERVNGQTFYYTLTYNDAAIPQYFGMNCFDYEDLRDLLTGGFRKKLLRDYGTIFKYFIGAELGDGKGSRGMHNNPHYHILFFLEPDPKSQYPYQVISPDDFRHLVKMYWQGFDETRDGFRDYRTCKYGVAKEGDNCGLVTDFRACIYCAKYVVKDVSLKVHEDHVRHCLRLKFKDSLKGESFYKDFFETVLNPKFNTPADSRGESWSMTPDELYRFLFPGRLDWSLPLFGSAEALCTFYTHLCTDIVSAYSLEKELRDFFNSRLDELVEAGLNEYRNRYCNKCRISHGVGDSALDDLRGLEFPELRVPDKKGGWKARPISLYYYRKLFTEVIRPIAPSCPHMKPIPLSPIRILNEEGVKYRLRRLDECIRSKYDDARTNLELVLSDPSLFEKMLCSDVNVDVFLSHSQLVELYNRLSNEKTDFLLDYAVYKLVYEGRYYSSDLLQCSDGPALSPLDYRRDYERFLVPSFYSVDRSDIRLDSFLEGSDPSALPYFQHPRFSRFIGIFNVLDLCADYFYIQEDDRREAEARERARIKRFFDVSKLQEYYSHFK